jgi:mRNA interferase MazF
VGGGGLGEQRLKRGDIRWYTFRLPDKRRPVLILTRNEVVDRLNEIIVVPATRTIRGLTSEVVLTADDGMPTTSALNFDHISLAQRSRMALSCVRCQTTGGPMYGEHFSSRAASETQVLANNTMYPTSVVELNQITLPCADYERGSGRPAVWRSHLQLSYYGSIVLACLEEIPLSSSP